MSEQAKCGGEAGVLEEINNASPLAVSSWQNGCGRA